MNCSTPPTRKIKIFGLMGIFVISLLAGLLAVTEICVASTYKVIEVYSGDTIKVVGNGSEIIIKLAGIEAPVICGDRNTFSQPFSLESKGYLEGLILDKNITVKSFGPKCHDIIIAEIFMGKTNINLKMLSAGMAQVCSSEAPKSLDLMEYKRAEYEASSKKLGIWANAETHECPSAWWKKQRARSGCSMILLGILQNSNGLLK